MKTIHPTMGAILGRHRLLGCAVAVGLLVLFGFAPNGFAQTSLPLGLDNNYMVTGDYVVGGVGLRGLGDGSGLATGTITIPDTAAYAPGMAQQVPAGADIVVAYLYWATVESSGTFAGQKGFFQGYPITGAVLGNPNAPVSWSSGGCAGSSLGSKTMVAYRAEVSSLIPVDPNTGNLLPNTSYTVRLADSGKSGSVPFTLGATLVIIYRLLASTVPLNAVVIYDGAYAPSNTAQTMILPMLGFFQAGNDQLGFPIATKITHIVGNGQPNKLQSVSLNTVNLPSLYPGLPPFPGVYNQNTTNTLQGGGSWDNPTWFPNNYPPLGTAVHAGDSSATTVVTPSSSNKGCVSWGAVILSTTVQDTDLDGLPDVSKKNQGYCDAGANRGLSNQGTCPLNTNDPSWVPLVGANTPPGTGKDVFIQLDYMCLANPDGTANCDPAKGGVSYGPDPQALTNLTAAFSANGHGINVHIDPNHHIIPALTCMDAVDANGNPLYCPYPAQAGVVDWKLGYSFLKSQPLNYPDETSCETQTILVNGTPTPGAGPFCVRRFQRGRNNSYHEVIFGVASATPDWYFLSGSLVSVVASGNTLTFTTSSPHGLAVNALAPNGRISIGGAISNPNLNGTFLVQGFPLDANGNPSTTSFTIQLAVATAAPTKATDPFLSVSSGVVNAGSGVSDIGGADSVISLGLWGADGQTVPVQSGTLMHELGHTLGLTHGGLHRDPVTGVFNFGPNCKSNFQSVMNYMFQVDLLSDPAGVDDVLDYSEETLPELDEVTGSMQVPSVLAHAIHPTTKWYTPTKPMTGSQATSHCDGTAITLSDASPTMYRVEGPASSLTWSLKQDLNFDGQIEASLQGYSDWANVDLRQIGASGNDFWAGGVPYVAKTSGGVPYVAKTSGGVPYVAKTSGGVPYVAKTSGGVGEINLKTASSVVRSPSQLSAMLTPANTVQLSFTPPGFGQSQIAAFNIYRSIDGPVFSLTYPMVPVFGTIPPPLPNQSFVDTKVSCGHTYSYFVTTVLSDGRESVPSNTAGPVSVRCTFVGFLSPLSTASQALSARPTFSGSRNLGNSAPIKWELLDANGNPIGDLTTLKLMQACPTTGATSAPTSSTAPPCVLIFSPLVGGEGNTTFRFSSPNFIINWDTGSLSGLSPGFWTIELQLSDGRTYWTNLQF